MRKIFSILILLLATLFVASCSGNDDEKKDTVKEITMYVSSEMGIMFGLDPNNPEECMLVKIDDPNGEWQKLALNSIWWFSYERGHEYVLRVKMTILANPPADGGDRKYELISIVEDNNLNEEPTPPVDDKTIKTEADIVYQEHCPFEKYKLFCDNFIVNSEGDIFSGVGVRKPSYLRCRIYFDNVMDKGNDNWYEFQRIPYQAYCSYVISPLTEEIKLVYNESGGPLFKDVIPENEFEHITQTMKSGETLRYYLILSNVYRKGLQKCEFTITKQ